MISFHFGSGISHGESASSTIRFIGFGAMKKEVGMDGKLSGPKDVIKRRISVIFSIPGLQIQNDVRIIGNVVIDGTVKVILE